MVTGLQAFPPASADWRAILDSLASSGIRATPANLLEPIERFYQVAPA